MRLLDNMMTECVLLEKHRIPDGAGGWHVEWKEGAHFPAHLKFNNSLQSKIAEKEGVESVFTVTTYRDTQLEFHDVFRRISDGDVFRVTSHGSDIVAPKMATINISEVSAERWVLTT